MRVVIRHLRGGPAAQFLKHSRGCSCLRLPALDGPLETAARKYSPPVLLMAVAAPPDRPREAGLDKQSTEQIYH
jgi:hypothetical protein